MKKTINVDATYVGMRIDRFLRKYFESIPQSLIEKSLRSGKIKLNKKKIKSSSKLKINDFIELHNFEVKKVIISNLPVHFVVFRPSSIEDPLTLNPKLFSASITPIATAAFCF